MTIRTFEKACLAAGIVTGLVVGATVTHLIWSGIHDSHLKDDRDDAAAAAKYVETKTLDNINLSRNLEQGLAQDAKTTDAIVDRAKASLRKTPWVMVEKCQAAGYTIQPGFGPDDWYDAYRSGRNSVLYPEGVRQGSSDHTPDSSGAVSASAAPR